MFLDKVVALVGGGLYGISDELDCNVYLLVSESEAALFDAGCGIDSGPLIRNVSNCGIKALKYIFLTHAHADHASGTKVVQSQFGGQVVASEQEARLVEEGSDYALGLEHAKRGGTYPQNFRYVHHPVNVKAQHNAAFTVGALSLRALLVPGHSVGSMCYLVEGAGQRRLFTGDTVMVGGYIDLINVPGSDLGAYREYLPRLAGLSVNAMFPGHLMWRLRDSQRHIDYAIAQLQISRMPRNLISFSV
jgi:glyoxylase-like metal-dependent hydrolase (beta-lactamase superfamily II)